MDFSDNHNLNKMTVGEWLHFLNYGEGKKKKDNKIMILTQDGEEVEEEVGVVGVNR